MAEMPVRVIRCGADLSVGSGISVTRAVGQWEEALEWGTLW